MSSENEQTSAPASPGAPSLVSLPKWLLGVILAGAVIVVAAVVVVAVVVVGSANAQTAKEAARASASAAAAAAEKAKLAQIPKAVDSCGADSSLVTNGGRLFTATLGFSGNVTDAQFKCVLTTLNAPSSVMDLPGSVFAGDPPKSAGWGDFTYTIDYPGFLQDSTESIAYSG